jgi:hypothetical protein
MYVIIFSIDKNYGVCRELKMGLVVLKNPPNPLGKGELHQLDPKQILIIRKSYFLKNSWGAPSCDSPFKGG